MVTVCHSSTLNSRLLGLNPTEQSQNVYENKGEVQKVQRSSRFREVRAALVAARGNHGIANAEFSEQSQNVYENKGEGQKVQRLSRFRDVGAALLAVRVNHGIAHAEFSEQSQNV